MPELPLVETTRRRVLRRVRGRQIVAGWAKHDPLMMPDVTPDAWREATQGRRVVNLHRRGKYLWIELDQPPHPVLHFGMTGALEFARADAARPKHTIFELTFDDGLRLILEDPRRFGSVRLVRDPRHEPPLSHLGFDPLLDRIPEDEFFEALRRRRVAVKAALLDQRFAAGVGNWMADEILYQARVSPRRLAARLSIDEARRILHATIEVTRVAVKARNDERRFPRTWLFHHRWGKAKGAMTSRGEAIRFTEVGGRTTAWVPARQG